MRVHKRKKRTRMRGTKSQGWGFKQKHKGSGNKGGKGMSGSGAHKRQKAREMDEGGKYFGRRGLTSRSFAKKKYDKINLEDIKNNFDVKKKIDLTGYRILGDGLGFKGEIIADSATSGAIEKMEKAGGKLILLKQKEDEEVEEVKEEKKITTQDGAPKPTKKSA